MSAKRSLNRAQSRLLARKGTELHDAAVVDVKAKIAATKERFAADAAAKVARERSLDHALRRLLDTKLAEDRAIEARHRAAYAAREAGATWEEVALVLGVTHQAVSKRYGAAS